MYKLLFAFLLLFSFVWAQEAEKKSEYKIVSLDNSAVEILFKLGLGKSIIGKNSTCSFPAEVKDIPSVGDHHTLNLEGILNLRPTHLIVDDQITEIQQKQIASVKSIRLIKLPSLTTLETIQEKVKIIAEAFAVVSAGETLIESIKNDFEWVIKKKAELKEDAPRFLCVYMRGVDALYMLGNDSSSVGLCKFVGIIPCYPDLERTIPLNTEAFVKADPDLFIVFTSGLKSIGGLESFLKIPGVALTKAGKNKRIISIDGPLLSIFGPRTGIAAKKLFEAAHQEKGFVEVQ